MDEVSENNGSVLKQFDCDEELVKALKNYSISSSAQPAVPGVQIRSRPPFFQVKNLFYRNIPLWAAYELSCSFVDQFAEELETQRAPFVDGVYDGIDATLWCRRIISRFEEFIGKHAKEEKQLPVKPADWDKYLFSLSSQKNRKPKMEDRHTILPTFSVLTKEENISGSFFAVFDGHHGSECASYCASHFHDTLLELRQSEENKNNLLKKVFESFDKRLTLRCKHENIKSGTTASCVYISDGVAYLGWCGDSSIGMLQNDCVVTLSSRHQPDDPEEQKRIEDAGGMVVLIQGEPRVNGVLNISRSLGDIQAKPMISSTPDTRKYTLTDTDYLLFLASDGVWDSLVEDEILFSLKEFVATHSTDDYKSLADFISQKAKENGSSDNLTLIVVFLQPVQTVWDHVKEKNPTGSNE
ncbi:protein phosphatase 2C domain-containing protein [Ditylenchus destructor]|uniref:Protein phosphatase 2C domain-containing protein n=1 Tax=Ditylenchus destructor TaxID=166010 RepID=A0AAD4RB67_9BILA|nr:protein phosphatase 2C domain-containing protein [Ditylenchus destructor]